MVPLGLVRTLSGNAPLGSAAPLASIVAIDAPVLENVRVAPGYCGTLPSMPATDRTPLAVLGEPTTYAPGPLLPADATTVIPSLKAFWEATDVGSSTPPSGEPSDMLITSTPSATARLMARSTTLLDPAHPNTR